MAKCQFFKYLEKGSHLAQTGKQINRGHLERMSQDGRLAFVSRSALSSHLHMDHDSCIWIHDDDCDENYAS